MYELFIRGYGVLILIQSLFEAYFASSRIFTSRSLRVFVLSSPRFRICGPRRSSSRFSAVTNGQDASAAGARLARGAGYRDVRAVPGHVAETSPTRGTAPDRR